MKYSPGEVCALVQRAEDLKAQRDALLEAAKEITSDIDSALKGGSQDTFMSLVTRLGAYRKLLRAAIAKCGEGK